MVLELREECAHTFAEIGFILGVSTDRARQIYIRAARDRHIQLGHAHAYCVYDCQACIEFIDRIYAPEMKAARLAWLNSQPQQ